MNYDSIYYAPELWAGHLNDDRPIFLGRAHELWVDPREQFFFILCDLKAEFQ